MDTLLKFEYPQEIMITFRYFNVENTTFHIFCKGSDFEFCLRLFSGDFEYEMAFDINLKDVSGQNALYIACQMGNQRLVDALLKYNVESRKLGEKRKSIVPSESVQSLNDSSKVVSPTKRKVSDGIQGIISRLSFVTNQNLISVKVQSLILLKKSFDNGFFKVLISLIINCFNRSQKTWSAQLM